MDKALLIIKEIEEESRKRYIPLLPFTKYQKDDIIDITKPVKWNREEVERRNAIFDYEVNRLKNCQIERVNELKESLMQTLSEANELPIQVVRKIWSYAWSKESRHDYNMVYLEFKELANLYKDLLNTED